MKKYLIILLIFVVAFSAFGRGTTPEPPAEDEKPKVEEPKPAAKPAIKNPDTFIVASIGDMQSLDPARAYDNASYQNMGNIYESLIDYDGEETGKFVPLLATEVPTAANGGISSDGKTYRFKIRKGVKFHSGHILTPEDVEYTFERNLVVDQDGGPNWIWYQYFLGTGGSRDGDGNITVDFKDIDQVVEVDGDYVVFTLPSAFPPFLSVMANTMAIVVCKDWVTEQGGWDGTEATWKNYNNPEAGKETLHEIANGTGPYRLERWEKETEVVLERFDDYWGPKPAMKKGIYRIVDEWSTRKLMLIQGDADVAYVPGQYWPDMDKEAGLTVMKNLPSLGVTGMNFNYKISVKDNPLAGSGKLDGEGIPENFFDSKDVRLGFVYAWDEDTFLEDVYRGEAMDPVTPITKGLPYKDESLKSLPHDMKKAEEHFKKAFDGQLWANGFKMDILFNTGNDVRETICNIMAENLMAVNPKFKITVRGVEWPEYINMIIDGTMPLFVIGWGPDYPDPDNFVYPYMHSNGVYAGWSHYYNPEVDKLIEQGGIELDPAKRKEIYYRLQEIYVEDAVGRLTSQVFTRRYMRDWVKGLDFYNPIKSDAFCHLPLIKKEY
jgi:peptide/nickel transport system substrate-binding protein